MPVHPRTGGGLARNAAFQQPARPRADRREPARGPDVTGPAMRPRGTRSSGCAPAVRRGSSRSPPASGHARASAVRAR